MPTVTNVSPTGGPTAGGTSVTITGTNFYNGTSNATVSFGVTAATSVTVNTPTSITAIAPAHTAGTVDITVTTPTGTSATSSLDRYTYYAPPTVTSISPTAGSTAGGTPVTITGTNFTGATAVTFGGTAATPFTVVNATTITTTTPAHTAGAVNVVVTTPGGSGTLTGGFTYHTPTVTSVSANQGPTGGGTTVTITGTYFTGATSATFGGTAGTSFSVTDDQHISVKTPAHAAGAVNVAVVNSIDSGTLTNGFTYVAAPTVTNVSPNQGSTNGGTSVTITGTDFYTGATVTFGGASATGVNVVNSTTITATTPSHAAGVVNVVVTSVGGTGTGVGLFTYVHPRQ